MVGQTNGRKWVGLLGVAFLCAACGPKTLQAKLLNAERRATDAETAIDEAERQMRALEPDLAQRALEKAASAMADPDVGYYPEREPIAQRLEQAKGRLPGVRKERDRRDLELAVGARR